MKTAHLVNAVEMSELSANFELLPHEIRYWGLHTGDLAKVCAPFPKTEDEYTGERFWVIVTQAKPGHYQGTIDNDLKHSNLHGLQFGDLIAFDYRHIYQICHRSKLNEWISEIEERAKE